MFVPKRLSEDDIYHPLHSNLVHTLYKTDKIKMSSVDNYHSVQCSQPIKKYDVLHIEHVLSVPMDESTILTAIVHSNIKLYNSLYPRRDQWNKKLLKTEVNKVYDDLVPKLNEKIHHNVFSYNNVYMLGNHCSYFNSSENFNAFTRVVNLEVDLLNFPEDTLYILVTVASRDIEPGEEVFLYYPCEAVPMNYEVQQRYITEASCLPHQDEQRVQKFVNGHVEKYFRKFGEFTCVLLNQMLAFIGLFYDNGMYITTNRYHDFHRATYPFVNQREAISQTILVLVNKLHKVRLVRSSNNVLRLKD